MCGRVVRVLESRNLVSLHLPVAGNRHRQVCGCVCVMYVVTVCKNFPILRTHFQCFRDAEMYTLQIDTNLVPIC